MALGAATNLELVTAPLSTNQSDSMVSTERFDNTNEKIEYNERWMGYLSIITCSGINFISISIVNPQYENQFEGVISLAFGILTFLIASLILLQDRSQRFLDYFDYTKARNGCVEGGALVFMAIWWIVGVGVITKPSGIAYHASNIYYSSWGSLFSCIYTLDLWSTEKDILSIAEITGVSFTIKSWWLHFLSACVVFACSFNLHVIMRTDAPDTTYAVILGLVSMAVSIFWIGVHLNFFTMLGVQEGGWFELFSSFFLMFVWIVGLGVFTTDGGIAAKMEGDECKSDLSAADVARNCTVTLVIEDSNGFLRNYEISCGQLPGVIPGSNLYYSCWLCMLSSITVAFKWKASQALKFAQAQAERQYQREQDLGEGYFGEDDEDDAKR